MADFRKPGPMCYSTRLGSLLDGTLALRRTPLPGPIGVISQPQLKVAALAVATDLTSLIQKHPIPVLGLSSDDYKLAANSLGVDVATIKAVAEVESSGAAFDESGRPRILFERHYFHRLTGGRYDKDHARISSAITGGYGTFSGQYGKLEEAYALAPDEALQSASWGRFQIMGENFKAAGYASVRLFVKDIAESESAQLRSFVSFVNNNKAMREALVKKDWATFAKAYNGSGYKKNLYDTKLKTAYDGLSKSATDSTASPSTTKLP